MMSNSIRQAGQQGRLGPLEFIKGAWRVTLLLTDHRPTGQVVESDWRPGSKLCGHRLPTKRLQTTEHSARGTTPLDPPVLSATVLNATGCLHPEEDHPVRSAYRRGMVARQVGIRCKFTPTEIRGSMKRSRSLLRRFSGLSDCRWRLLVDDRSYVSEFNLSHLGFY